MYQSQINSKSKSSQNTSKQPNLSNGLSRMPVQRTSESQLNEKTPIQAILSKKAFQGLTGTDHYDHAKKDAKATRERDKKEPILSLIDGLLDSFQRTKSIMEVTLVDYYEAGEVAFPVWEEKIRREKELNQYTEKADRAPYLEGVSEINKVLRPLRTAVKNEWEKLEPLVHKLLKIIFHIEKHALSWVAMHPQKFEDRPHPYMAGVVTLLREADLEHQELIALSLKERFFFWHPGDEYMFVMENPQFEDEDKTYAVHEEEISSIWEKVSQNATPLIAFDTKEQALKDKQEKPSHSKASAVLELITENVTNVSNEINLGFSEKINSMVAKILYTFHGRDLLRKISGHLFVPGRVIIDPVYNKSRFGTQIRGDGFQQKDHTDGVDHDVDDDSDVQFRGTFSDFLRSTFVGSTMQTGEPFTFDATGDYTVISENPRIRERRSPDDMKTTLGVEHADPELSVKRSVFSGIDIRPMTSKSGKKALPHTIKFPEEAYKPEHVAPTEGTAATPKSSLHNPVIAFVPTDMQYGDFYVELNPSTLQSAKKLGSHRLASLQPPFVHFAGVLGTSIHAWEGELSRKGDETLMENFIRGEIGLPRQVGKKMYVRLPNKSKEGVRFVPSTRSNFQAETSLSDEVLSRGASQLEQSLVIRGSDDDETPKLKPKHLKKLGH
ncbi:hypothetical protein [Aureibacter tunicatorum]|uniref:FlaG/YvyC family protein n=1 Tax=Aureibacter tunicatorum TaxID=866807 RepID=A0AAE3XKS3_9BACT|nr:hypothetical protein [Aureibacter tunicatorum]MDR6238697.1 putative FlaG/YvyC family protein [Aureibacter tunicatorum]BDD05372.1 hypothetical protein AUTU_28550 [Aureibacter tunicatorum]